VPTLSELIQERRQLRGFSYADLENRAGAVITRQRWQQLGTGVRIKEFPEPATIEAMATALDVDVAVIVLSAARSIGLDVKRGAQSDLAAMLPHSAKDLSVVQRDAIVTLVRSITEPENVDTSPSAQEQAAPGEEDQEQKNLDESKRRGVAKIRATNKKVRGKSADSKTEER
jgi:transcriptional regulator with XRE-family HTH domain